MIISDAELDQLEAYLHAEERGDDTLTLDAAQGLICAVVSAPRPILPAAWMPAILGEGHVFKTDRQAEEIAALLTRLHGVTAEQLGSGDGFDFILYGPQGEEADMSIWCEGYLVGVDLADPPWEEGTDPEDLDSMIFPFLALSGRAREIALEAGEEWMDEAEERKMLSEYREGLADHLVEVRHYWFERSIPGTVKREVPKVGRNDPCPCGSGKKFKNCCANQPSGAP